MTLLVEWQVNNHPEVILWMVLCFVVAAIFAAFGWDLWRHRRGMIERIKTESKRTAVVSAKQEDEEP